MRVLHLGFQLDCPFGDERVFREKDREVFQPFFAFLERNVQKYPEFRVSLQITGAWIEQAEKYNRELIERLKKLANLGKIDFLAMPYYNSLAFFYDAAEFEAEMWLHKEKLHDLFEATCRVCAFPDLMYNDRLAQAAERLGYYGVLAGGLPENLVRRYESRVYDAHGCRQVRVLWRNTELSEFLMTELGGARFEEGVAKDEDAQMKKVRERALVEFRKKLDLITMRGGVVNIFLDAEIFARQRQAGVIKFLDDFLALWLKKPESLSTMVMATATDLATMRGVEDEISLRKTVSWRDGWSGGKEDVAMQEPGLVRMSEIEFRPTVWLDGATQRRVLKEFYVLKPEVFRTEDEDLIAEFCALSTLDQVYAMSSDAAMRGKVLGASEKASDEMADEILAKMEQIQERVAEIWREKQAEIERRQVKVVKEKKAEKQDRTDESTEVTVNFGGKTRGNKVVEVEDDREKDDGVVEVKFGEKGSDWSLEIEDVVRGEDGSATEDGLERVSTELAQSAEQDSVYSSERNDKPNRRILKKIVIE